MRHAVGVGLHAACAILIATACAAPPITGTNTTKQGGTRRAAWLDIAPGVSWRRATVRDESRELEWQVLRIDLRVAHPRIEHRPDPASNENVIAAINGGFFEPDQSASGALYSGGTVLGEPNPRGGSGVLIIRGNRAEVVPSDQTLPTPDAVDLAVQCGPRLIERDGSVGIHRDDGMRYARTAACLRENGQILDLIVTWRRREPMRGPGLLAFSQRLAAPSPVGDRQGCESALNFDGGPSTAIYVRNHPSGTHGARNTVPFWLVITGSGQ